MEEKPVLSCFRSSWNKGYTQVQAMNPITLETKELNVYIKHGALVIIMPECHVSE